MERLIKAGVLGEMRVIFIMKYKGYFPNLWIEAEEKEVFVVGVRRWVEMKVEFWISDFHFEIEVQMIMDLMDRKMKIWVRISSGKEPHPLCESLKHCSGTI